jgi:hypothetical protein
MEEEVYEGFRYFADGSKREEVVVLTYFDEDCIENFKANNYHHFVDLGEIDSGIGFDIYINSIRNHPRFFVQFWAAGEARNDDCLFADSVLELNVLLKEIQPLLSLGQQMKIEYEEG